MSFLGFNSKYGSPVPERLLIATRLLVARVKQAGGFQLLISSGISRKSSDKKLDSYISVCGFVSICTKMSSKRVTSHAQKKMLRKKHLEK